MRRESLSAGVRRAVARWRALGLDVAFVPTMGGIHDGHLSLVRRAREGADRVVASIFVNPLQFGPKEDYRRYPRPRLRDRALLKAAGVDLLWEPGVEELYADGHVTRVQVRELDEALEGMARPGHFEGVATVVLKLLNVVTPDVLWVGQKDAQQAVIIERMVGDLLLPVKVRRGQTVREADGLAMSSRNAYLTPEQRADAVAIPRGLAAVLRALRGGERDAQRLRRIVRAELGKHAEVKAEYVAVVDPATLRPVRRVRGRVLIAVAARVGRARLIDNLEWRPK
jgi:pantoate--beta-alanine ligase